MKSLRLITLKEFLHEYPDFMMISKEEFEESRKKVEILGRKISELNQKLKDNNVRA